MPNVKWETPLLDWQTADPFLHHETVTLPDDVPIPTLDERLTVFPKRAYSLKTWGRVGESGLHSPGSNKTAVLSHDPHWIGVRRSMPLHTDPAYPRYSHQLVIIGKACQLLGISKVITEIDRGSFYILDGHSPHQLLSPKQEWYIAVSIDAHERLEPAEVLPPLIAYAQSTPFLPDPESTDD